MTIELPKEIREKFDQWYDETYGQVYHEEHKCMCLNAFMMAIRFMCVDATPVQEYRLYKYFSEQLHDCS